MGKRIEESNAIFIIIILNGYYMSLTHQLSVIAK